MKDRSAIVYLDITSYRGVSVGAEHFYGKLVNSGEKYEVVELEQVMTKKMAIELNKKDGFGSVGRAGSKTDRFLGKDKLIGFAKKEYKKHFPKAKLLLLGNSSSVSVKKVLDCESEDVLKKCNKLYDEYKKIEWINRGGFFYRTPEGEVLEDELYGKWAKILEKYLEG